MKNYGNTAYFAQGKFMIFSYFIYFLFKKSQHNEL